MESSFSISTRSSCPPKARFARDAEYRRDGEPRPRRPPFGPHRGPKRYRKTLCAGSRQRVADALLRPHKLVVKQRSTESRHLKSMSMCLLSIAASPLIAFCSPSSIICAMSATRLKPIIVADPFIVCASLISVFNISGRRGLLKLQYPEVHPADMVASLGLEPVYEF